MVISVVLEIPELEELKRWRLRLGLTQSQVARSAGVSQPLIARIERGSVDPRLSTLRAILKALRDAERREVKLKDVMTHPDMSVSSTDTVHSAIQLMREKGFSQVPVVSKGFPVGSLHERTIIHLLSEKRNTEELSKALVGEIMGPPFPMVEPAASTEEVYGMLEDASAVLVVERGKLVGLVSKSDLLNLL
jgi:predicted transcriptional regulator